MKLSTDIKTSPANTKSIPLFYWSERRFIFKEKENYGDLLSKYLVEKVSGKPVKFVHPKKQPWYKWNKKNYLAIGSIIHHATKESIVWGSGIIDNKQKITKADFRAVRGPRTRKYLINLGYDCPEIYGDPAILLPKYFNPPVVKKYKIGVIPHYLDVEMAQALFKDQEGVIVIDLMTMDVENVTLQIMSCECTISSSLHGIIVSHAYNIPSIQVKFSDKIFGNGIKYKDYFESVGIEPYSPIFIAEKTTNNSIEDYMKELPELPEINKISNLQEGLIKAVPFV